MSISSPVRRTLPILFAFATLLGGPDSLATEKVRVYIGTYTDKGSEGIYACELDLGDGALENTRVAAKAKDPNFLAFHPTGKFLYAVGNVEGFADSQGGALSAFAIDPATGDLTLLGSQSSIGAGPCHVAIDRTGRCALVANYGAGSVAALPIGQDGRLAPAAVSIKHAGSSVNPQRQTAPHAHSANISPDNRFALVADLGVDKIFVYRLDADRAMLTPHDPPSASLAPGAGPRHLAFHPSGKFVYVINELTSTVTPFKYDAGAGALEPLKTVTTLPPDFTGENTTAEVQVHPSGRFLYGSNRGHDSIAMFAIDAGTGELAPLGHHPTGGRTPRNFGVDPTGAYLLAANQNSDTVTVHRIDPQTGKLVTTDHVAKIPTPVCVKMLPLP